MTPTLDWAKKAFDDCNKKYFEGKLEPPTFVLDQKKNTLGCSWNRVKRLDPLGNPYYPSFIYMSTYYDRTEDELVGTMIHEMIHYWSFVNDLPVDHGDVFKDKCLEINQKTNFKYKLERTASVKGSKANKDIQEKRKAAGTEKAWIIAYTTPSMKYWAVALIGDTAYDKFKQNITNIINKNPHAEAYFGKVNRSDGFDHMSLCRKSFRGDYYATADLKVKVIDKMTELEHIEGV